MVEGSELTQTPLEKELSALLDQAAARSKVLLLGIFRDRQEHLPEILFWEDRERELSTNRKVVLVRGRVAGTHDHDLSAALWDRSLNLNNSVYLSEEGMFWVKTRASHDDKGNPKILMPDWSMREEVEPLEYLIYADTARKAIIETLSGRQPVFRQSPPRVTSP